MIDLSIQGLGMLPATAESADAPFKPDLTLLDRTLRRGLSDVTRLFFHVAQAALLDARVAASDVRLVFASAFGEIGTAEAMLAQALDDNSASPARFRNSVHNTAPGLLSISARNTLASSAIAAGIDTVAMGLLESQLLLSESALPVLLVFADEPVPARLRDGHELPSLGVAFVLTRPTARGRARLTHLHRDGAIEAPADKHPLARAEVLAQSVVHKQNGRVILSEGRAPYCVDVDARES
jgi:hypothetical protein